MGGPQRLSRDDLEALVDAPFRIYSTVATVDGEAIPAQFRCLREEIAAGPGVFAEGTVGRLMVDALGANLDVLWEGYRASSRSPRDGLRRAAKALRRVPDDESAAVRDWLLALATRIAEVRRPIGDQRISAKEAKAIRDLAHWLGRPVPASATG
jgi:hypothetical protein